MKYSRRQITEAIAYWKRQLNENTQFTYEFSAAEQERFDEICKAMPKLGGIDVDDKEHFAFLTKGFCKWRADGGDAFNDDGDSNAKLFGVFSNSDVASFTLYGNDPRHAPRYTETFNKCFDVPGMTKTVDFDLYRGISDQELESIQKRLEHGTKNLELMKSKSFSSSYKHAYTFAISGAGSGGNAIQNYSHDKAAVITLHTSKPVLCLPEIACAYGASLHVYDGDPIPMEELDDIGGVFTDEDEYIVSNKFPWELIDLEKLEFKC